MKLKNSQYLLIGLTLLASAYTLVAIFRWWRADAAFAKGKSLSDLGYVSEALAQLETATRLMPREPLFHDSLAETAAKIAYGLNQQQATAAARQAAQFALDASATTLKLNPVHLNFWKTRIRVWLILAQIDPNFYTQALQDFQSALSLHPTDAKLMYNLALLQLQLGQVDTARQTLEQTLNLKSNYTAAQEAIQKLQ